MTSRWRYRRVGRASWRWPDRRLGARVVLESVAKPRAWGWLCGGSSGGGGVGPQPAAAQPTRAIRRARRAYRRRSALKVAKGDMSRG